MKKSLFTIMLMTICTMSMAQEKVDIINLSLATGETKTLSIELTNEKIYTAFQMDIKLPKGLKIVPETDNNVSSVTLDANRSDVSHTVEYNEYRPGLTRIVAYSNTKATFKGNSGPLINVTIQAENEIKPGMHEIKLNNIIFTEASATGYVLDDVTKDIEVYKGYRVIVESENEAYGTVTSENCGEHVREGTTITAFAQPAEGYKFYAWRWKEGNNQILSTKNPYSRVMSQDMTIVADFNPKKYDVIFDIDGKKTKYYLEYASVITPPNVRDKQGYTFAGWIPEFVEGATVPLGGITYTAQWIVNTYQITYVVDGEVYQTDSIDYGEAIPPIEVPTKEGYIFSGWSGLPKTMPANDVTIIGTYTFDYNTAAYKRLTAQIAELQMIFDSAKATIETEYKDVAQNFSETIISIQKSIDDLMADIEARYKSSALTEGSTINTKKVALSIEQLLDDAKSAQAAYDAELAKIAANESAYIRLMAQIDTLQITFDTIKRTINTECKDVTSLYSGEIASIQVRISSLKSEIKIKYHRVELTTESTIDTASIIEAIETLLADAKSAQADYEAEQAKIAANEVAYARLAKQIAEVQTALDAAKDTININCMDVASQFEEQITTIQSQIDALSTDVKSKYEAVELTAESTVDTATIAATIETLLNDAKSAQAAYETEQAKIAANEAAYVRLTEQISELQAILDAATDSIHANCKDVASQFVEQIDSLQNVINAMSADIKVKYDNVELTTESVVDITSLSDAIVELLTNAEKAQKEYEEALSIGSVDTEEKVIEIYSLTGKEVSKTQKGLIYLFRYENGKTVKKLAK